MEIQEAVREKTWTLTSVSGPSGSGKTRSALLIARGIVGPGGKIGMIDTENKRSRHHIDAVGGFSVIDLDPPFTPARYIEAIQKFERAGYKAIVTDTISHEWEGTGGILEQAEAIETATRKEGLHCWNRPKKAHKKLVNVILQTQAHLIFCCRVKEKVKQRRNSEGRTEIVNEGWTPIAEKGFIYEMTVSLLIPDETHIPVILKAPEALRPAFAQERMLDQTNGALLAKWAEEGVEIDPKFTALKIDAMEHANQGMTVLRGWWDKAGSEAQRMLAPVQSTLRSIARAFDDMQAILADAGGDDFRTRMQNGQGSPQGGEEGFDASKVAADIEKLSGEPETGQGGQSEADQIAADLKPHLERGLAEAGLAEEQTGAATWSPEDQQKVRVQCRDTFLGLATDGKFKPADRKKSIASTFTAWEPEMSFDPKFLGRMRTYALLAAEDNDASADAIKILKEAA